MIWREIRIAARSLRRTPGVAAFVIVSLALGLGVATAMFSVVRGVLLKPLPYAHAGRIVRLMGAEHGRITETGTVAYLNVMDVRRAVDGFESVAAYDEWQPNLVGQGEAERLNAALVSASFFAVLGVHPAAGRFFLPQEDIDGQDSVVVLSYGLWQRKFGGDPSVVGRVISLNGRPHTVIGVAPQSFEDPLLSGPRWGKPVLWRPLGYEGVGADRQPNRGSDSYTAIGLRREGTSLRRLNAQVDTVMHRLRQRYPDLVDAGVGMVAVPLRSSMTGGVRRSLILLQGAVLFALLLMAANLGNLLLGRSLGRAREFAVRTALGATRRQLFLQLAIESLILALSGAVAGLALASLLQGVVARLGGSFVPRPVAGVLDGQVIAFGLLVAALVGVACSVAPVLRVSTFADLQSTLGNGGDRSGWSRPAYRMRCDLVAFQVAAAVVLLMGAGLLIKTYWKLGRVDPGLEASHVLSLDLAPSTADHSSGTELTSFYGRLLDRLRALPGVEADAIVNILPLSGGFDGSPVWPEGRQPAASSGQASAQIRTVTADYFRVMGIRLIRGRLFTGEERGDSAHVVVVNRRLAARLWPDGGAVGNRLVLDDEPAEVIGVVDDVKHLRLDQPAPPRVYASYTQGLAPWQLRNVSIVLRTAGNPEALAAPVRAAIRAIDDRVPVSNLQSMDHVVSESEAPQRFRAFLLGSFAVLALFLAAIGVYGVISHSVAQRSREIAIRMVVGAAASRVVGRVLAQGIRPVLVGLLFGVAGSFALGTLLGGLLFDVAPLDPGVLASVVMLMFGLALAASYLPARRASHVDPMRVLRGE